MLSQDRRIPADFTPRLPADFAPRLGSAFDRGAIGAVVGGPEPKGVAPALEELLHRRAEHVGDLCQLADNLECFADRLGGPVNAAIQASGGEAGLPVEGGLMEKHEMLSRRTVDVTDRLIRIMARLKAIA